MFNTDIAKDLPCGRNNCWPCNTSKAGTVKNCEARSILYETSCTLCNPEDSVRVSIPQEGYQEAEGEEKFVADPSHNPKERVGIYLGESSRSLHKRATEHVRDALKFQKKSHICKHWMTSHPDLKNPPPFRFRVLRTFKDCPSRQIGEAVSFF